MPSGSPTLQASSSPSAAPSPLAATESVDLTGMQEFHSQGVFNPKDADPLGSESSGYFVVLDDTIGPTTRTWWGGDYATLHVPLFNSCNNDVTVASIKAQQRACGSTWEMNAGRGTNDCDHNLVLKLNDVSLNPWMEQYEHSGCVFQSNPSSPIIFHFRRWHSPYSNALIGRIVLDFELLFATKDPTKAPSALPSLSPSITPPPDQCSITACSCEIGQVDYRGTLAVTNTGLPCQRWDAQSPHSHTRTASNYPDSGLEENYCRNPDGEDGVWCYTTSDVRWQLCDVPNCTPECCVSLAA